MSHTYSPAPASATAHAPTPTTGQAPAPAPATPARVSICVTHKWSIPLDIRPSHALPLHACVTPMHPWYCAAGSTSVTFEVLVPLRWSPFMDDLGSHTPLLYIKTG
ncbi:hypothetical protein O181_073925 [Austropuccinia psidii MF-1]|uniref:Uncharacterized protein n=1 Tax=Austropuccinia psidii MF-1 TaxID=1389203 RepID=A0A9Q3F3J1_9BASI|nr:hypothetical protein [Austropuccinia psidii MF-1]